VQLLERFFYPEVLGEPVDPGWTHQLLEALRSPTLTVNRLGALGWRLRRNYLWIYTAAVVTWVGKLYISGQPTLSPEELAGRAAIGPVPGWPIVVLIGLLYTCLLGIGLGAKRIYPLGDDEARLMMEQVPE
jgi:uncharacterized membrane protein